MSFEILVQLSLSGLTTGAVYSLIALGFVTIYRSSNILNLAQGEFVVLGGLLTVFLMKRLDFPYVLAGLSAVVIVTLLGFFIQKAIIRPIRDEALLILIMVTIGVSLFLSGSSALVFGPAPRSLPPIINGPPVALLDRIRVDPQSLFVLGITFLLLLGLYLLSQRTWYGKAMEAVSTDRLAAQLVGVSRDFVVMLSFGISAGIGAVAGIFITPLFFTQYNAGAVLGLKGFSAAVIGGWGKYPGAILGGFLLGLVESISVGFIPAGYKDGIAFLALLLILYFRPKGILGSRALEESRK